VPRKDSFRPRLKWTDDLSKATVVGGATIDRTGGGFLKRQIRPAVVECMDGSRITVEVVPYRTLGELCRHLKRAAAAYKRTVSVTKRRTQPTKKRPT
jgi:transposase InsO family protein